MPMLFLNGKTIFFAHIPKTGGSSIEAYLRSKGPLSFYSDRTISGLMVRPQHFHADIYTSLLSNDLLQHSFAVIRDPLARLKSEYRYRCREPEGLRKWFNKVTGNSRKSVKLGKRHRLLTFDEWAMKSISECKKCPTLADNHIRPQIDFILPKMKLFDFARGLDDVFRWIDTITETKPTAGDFHVNRSPSTRLDVSDTVSLAVKDFYAADYTLLEEIRTSDTPQGEPLCASEISKIIDSQQP